MDKSHKEYASYLEKTGERIGFVGKLMSIGWSIPVIIIGLIMGLVSYYMLTTYSESTQGTIIQISNCGVKSSNMKDAPVTEECKYQVSYKVDGKDYILRYMDAKDRYTVGETVRVNYNSENHSEAEIHNTAKNMVAYAFLGVSFFLIITHSFNIYASLKSGEYATAQAIDNVMASQGFYKN